MIDTHSHIYAEEFDLDRAEAVRRAVDSGVTHFVLPAIDSQSHDKMFEVADLFPNHYPTIGLHPTSIKGNFRAELDLANHFLTTRKVYAIGEIGLDLYWDKSFIKEQTIALKEQLNWAIKYDLPAIIHTREAYSEMINVMSDFSGSPLRAVFHSYSSNAKDAETLLSMGNHLLGIGGVVTFKKSNLGDVVREVGIENVVLETDAPYLAPVPHRGRRNESSYIPLIVSHLAQLLDMDEKDIDNITTSNAKKLFKI